MELNTKIENLKWIGENNEDEKEESLLLLKQTELEVEKIKNSETDFARRAEIILQQEESPYKLHQMYQLCLEYDNETTHQFQKAILPICKECHILLESKSGMYVCTNCGHYERKMEKAVPKSTNKNEKTIYDPKDNFKCIVYTFQGKKSKKIPNHIYDIIENSFKKYHIDDFSNMKKETLVFILQENKLSDFYEDINVIYEHYTKIKPPDLSLYEDNIFKRNALVEEIFNQVKTDERQNSLNNFFKLYAFLNMEGFYCNFDEFPALKTRNVVVYHNQTMKKICDILQKYYPDMNWKFKPYC